MYLSLLLCSPIICLALYLSLIYYRKITYKTPSLTGKVAIVTGASRGIGKGIAIALGESGMTVYITGRSKYKVSEYNTSLEITAKLIEEAGGVAKMIECDHFNDDEVISMIHQVYQAEGRIDVLVNNVFYVPSGRWTMPFWEQKTGYWDPTFACGVRCHYLASCYAAEYMVKDGSGLIVNISSAGAKGYMYNPAYGAGKAAVDKMSRDMGQDLKKYNVGCVSLWPGLVKTEYIVQKKESYKRHFNVDIDQLGEDPTFTGKAISNILNDNYMKWNGKVVSAADVAGYYGFRDVDGSFPTATGSIRFYVLYAFYRVKNYFKQ
eukprot:TRINITY_DN4326_c0_g1_i1.p1 TRINITY_DN4326_c0_g1~~TRINITY_DN4326_c0_g1_i1.p1  ORF type:complete len:328 (+),score=51.83 TRINITY_DN4326_c0_g1_i1:25-984(+)